MYNKNIKMPRENKGDSLMFKPNTKHQQKSLFETDQWMSESVRNKLAKTWAPLFYELVFSQIDEKPFAALYGTTGAPNVPVNTLLSLEIIKHMKGISDLDLLELYNFDYLVNVAVGQRVLGEDSLSPRTLYYFRERLYLYTMEHPDLDGLIFGQFVGLLNNFTAKAGLHMEDQRIDTTMFMSNIKKSGRMSLAHDVLARAVSKIPDEKLSDALKEVKASTFKRDMLYRAKAGQTESRLNRLLTLCGEAQTLLYTLAADEAVDEKRIIDRLLKEQANISDDGMVTAKENKEIHADSLQPAYDEDATYHRKGDVAQSGYVLSVTETCSKENPMQLITDYHVESNAVPDTKIIESRIETIAQTNCDDLYADGGFYSSEIVEQAAESGITMHYTDMAGTEPQYKVSTADFQLNEKQNEIELCPNGQKPIRVKETKNELTAHFEKKDCEKCPLYNECPCMEQKTNTVVRLTKKSITAVVYRADIAEDIKENTSYRAAIEGTNSALKKKGLKKLGVRGKIKCAAVCGLKVIAQNVKRTIKFMQGGYQLPKNPISPAKGVVCSL
jgi:hypothetical protein